LGREGEWGDRWFIVIRKLGVSIKDLQIGKSLVISEELTNDSYHCFVQRTGQQKARGCSEKAAGACFAVTRGKE